MDPKQAFQIIVQVVMQANVPFGQHDTVKQALLTVQNVLGGETTQGETNDQL